MDKKTQMDKKRKTPEMNGEHANGLHAAHKKRKRRKRKRKNDLLAQIEESGNFLGEHAEVYDEGLHAAQNFLEMNEEKESTQANDLLAQAEESGKFLLNVVMDLKLFVDEEKIQDNLKNIEVLLAQAQEGMNPCQKEVTELRLAYRSAKEKHRVAKQKVEEMRRTGFEKWGDGLKKMKELVNMMNSFMEHEGRKGSSIIQQPHNQDEDEQPGGRG